MSLICSSPNASSISSSNSSSPRPREVTASSNASYSPDRPSPCAADWHRLAKPQNCHALFGKHLTCLTFAFIRQAQSRLHLLSAYLAAKNRSSGNSSERPSITSIVTSRLRYRKFGLFPHSVFKTAGLGIFKPCRINQPETHRRQTGITFCALSRVTPGWSSTMAWRVPVSSLYNVDLPTFGAQQWLHIRSSFYRNMVTLPDWDRIKTAPSAICAGF